MSATDPKTYLVYDPRDTSRNPKPYKVRIDREFESLIAPLHPQEHAQLEADIRAQAGRLRDKITVWQDVTKDYVVLLDGHTRLSILAKLQAEELAQGVTHPKIYAELCAPDTESIPDRDAALLWIEENQIGRRNLTDDQRVVIWDSIRERRSAIAKRERAVTARAARDQDEPRLSVVFADKPQAPVKDDTRKEVAAESGLPESKLRAVAALKKSSPDKVQEVRAGKTTLRAATKQSKPHLAPAILTVKELMDWWNSCEDDGGINVIPRKKPLVGTVDLHFCALDPTIAKKLAEFYLRLRKTQSAERGSASILTSLENIGS